MDNVYEYLRNKYPFWGWMGHRAHDASAINRVLPLDFILCCDYGMDIPLYFDENNIFSLEKDSGKRKNWSNEDLKESLDGDLGRDFFSRINNNKQNTNIICYRSLKNLENHPASDRYRILSSSEDKKRYFDNKILLHKKLPELGLERIPGKEDIVSARDFKTIASELSLPFAIRFPYGSSGQFVFIIRDASDYEAVAAQYSGHTAVFERYVNGFSININAVIIDTPDGVRTECSFPSVQLTGIPECSSYASCFCGNDFSAAADISKKMLGEIFDVAKKTGTWMGRYGFRGIFGMDMIISGKKIYPLEINPRFQNSTALFDTIQLVSGKRHNMLFLPHILQFLRYDDPEAGKMLDKYDFSGFTESLKGAQVILHNISGGNTIEQSVVPGIYRYGGTGLEYKKKTAVLTGSEADGDFLVTCAVPESGKIVENNAPLCKIQSLKNVVDPYNKNKLDKDAADVINGIYENFVFEKKMNEHFIEGNVI